MEDPMNDDATWETPPQGEATEEYPTLTSSPAVDAPDPDAAGAGDDDEWPVRAPSNGIRLALPVAGLIAVLLVGAGFWGGASLEKSHGGGSSSGGSLASAFASRLRAAAASGATGTSSSNGGGSGSGGFAGGGFGGSSAAATGTVSVVNGKTLYVLTADGALVKVTLEPSTTVSRNAKSSAVDLRPGDTVVVQGATTSNGDVSATSVAATAPGVSPGGGFGGRGFAGGSGGLSQNGGAGAAG
jgi:hypothetical protein